MYSLHAASNDVSRERVTSKDMARTTGFAARSGCTLLTLRMHEHVKNITGAVGGLELAPSILIYMHLNLYNLSSQPWSLGHHF